MHKEMEQRIEEHGDEEAAVRVLTAMASATR